MDQSFLTCACASSYIDVMSQKVIPKLTFQDILIDFKSLNLGNPLLLTNATMRHYNDDPFIKDLIDQKVLNDWHVGIIHEYFWITIYLSWTFLDLVFS